MNDIATLYSKSQQGGELPYFVGKQYGTGWFRNIARFAFPIVKRIGQAIYNTASDVIMRKRPLLPSLKNNAIEAAGSVLPTVVNMIKKPKTSINKRKRVKGTIFAK